MLNVLHQLNSMIFNSFQINHNPPNQIQSIIDFLIAAITIFHKLIMQKQSSSAFFQAQLVVPLEQLEHQIWISGAIFASHLEKLQKLQIGAICSVNTSPFAYPWPITHKFFQIQDHPDEDITLILHQTFEFIERERKKSNVLVHCAAGISRSAAVLAYYLMRKKRCTYEQAIHIIKESRPWVKPNKGFEEQLKGIEAENEKVELKGRL